jgi:phosphate transport system substrate-binding protein
MSERKSIAGSCGWVLFAIFTVFFNSCGNKDQAPEERYDRGVIHISVDESFRPVIDSQISVFESKYPEAKIIAHYKPEADCLRDFAVDSIRMVITTRGYSPAEKAFMNDSMQIAPSKMVIAYDAVALIVHPSSADTLMKMQDVVNLLKGETNSGKFPVFDGMRATSTVRFILDSVLQGEPLGKTAVAAESSEKVIEYVSRTPNAVGFIGVSWIGNPEDSTQLSYLEKVKVVQVEHPVLPGKYVTPAQFNIFYGRYPMLRQLVYVLKERGNGVAHGFANFLTGQKGQLIFKRAYLMPGVHSLGTRDAYITE